MSVVKDVIILIVYVLVTSFVATCLAAVVCIEGMNYFKVSYTKSFLETWFVETWLLVLAWSLYRVFR